MESVYLKTFLEVAATGNLTRAAENLYVTPSAVSRRIKFMEDQYGYSLLDRSGPLLVPTDAGRLVLEKAQQLIRIEKELLIGLTHIRKPPTFSFGCTPAFGIAHLPEVMRGFMLANAELNNLAFNFDMPENLVKGLKDSLFDLAVIEHCECLDLSGFITFALPEDEMVFAYSPLLFAGGQDITIDTLRLQPLYTRKEGCCSRKFLELNMERIGRSVIEFKRMIVYDDLHVIIDSVIKGHGIAYLSKSLISDQLAAGILSEHHIAGFLDTKKRTFILTDTAQQEKSTALFAREILKYFDLPCAVLPEA
jgi:LysR family transcriptional regulator, transcriptional activator of the cysJI operon